MRSYARTFPCPNCNEIINEEMKHCRFCSLPIDPSVAELIAGRQEQVNQAYSDASYLRRTAVAMYVFLAISTIFGWAFWAFVATFWIGIVLVIRWQLKFSNLITNDADYPKARRSKNISLFMVLGGLPLGLLLNPFFNQALFEYWTTYLP